MKKKKEEVDLDFIRTDMFCLCEKPVVQANTKPRKRKCNFNVTWFTLGFVAGMLVAAGMYNLQMIMS